MSILTCPNGHAGGTDTLQQMGRSDDDNLLVRCNECSEMFEVDDTGDDHEIVGGDD
jgi:hypothetical protein